MDGVEVIGCFLLSLALALFFLVVVPFIIALLTPASVHQQREDVIRANRKRWQDYINALESRARKGDLIALQQWKELTGREKQSESFFFFWWS
jgi:hypothetical protein